MLTLEQLESRLTPASASLDGAGNLVVTGNLSTPNNIVVNSTNAAATTVQVNGQLLGSFDISNRRAIVHGGSKNDLIQCPGYRPCEIHCGGGNDRVYGSVAGNVVFAESGDVLIVGGSGVDVLIGGNGRSTLMGGNGTDLLFAGTLPGWDYDDLRAIADAYAADPLTDLTVLETDFLPHTSVGKAQLSGGGLVHNAFFIRANFDSADDLVTDYVAGRDHLYQV